MPDPTDPVLVQRCLDGEEDAWRLLTERYADVVYGVAYRSGLRGAEAGDVVQEVFLALLKGLGRLRRRERLLAWVLKTARREAWRQVRRARAARRRDEAHAREDLAHGPLPQEALTRLEEEQTVREAFARLTERCRRLLDALFFRQPPLSYEEVSRVQEIPVGSIGPTRKRCLEALRGHLVSLGFEVPDVSGGTGSASRRGKGAAR